MRSLKDRLTDLLPDLAEVSQEVYESWKQDDTGYDEDFAYGGICDRIATEWEGVISSYLSRVTSMEVVGDGHAYLEVMYKDERCVIDLPASIYEYGGGYSWTKIPDVKITKDDFYISCG